jgi:hypothetical protein
MIFLVLSFNCRFLTIGIFIPDCDTEKCLVVARIRERLAVSKRSVNKMDMDRFNVKKLNEGEVKEQYQVTIKNKFSALENLKDNGDINRAWNAIRQNIKMLPKSVSVTVMQSAINHGLMRNVQNWLIKGSRLNYSGCRTQV